MAFLEDFFEGGIFWMVKFNLNNSVVKYNNVVLSGIFRMACVKKIELKCKAIIFNPNLFIAN